MSKKIIALIVLACLVAGATCSVFDCFRSKFECKEREQRADFYALNNYLNHNVRTSETAAILDYLKAYMSSLEDKPVRKAAELVVELSKMDKQCKQEYLPTLVQLAHANLARDWFGVVYRENNLLESLGLREIVSNCPKTLHDMYMAVYNTMIGKGFEEFLRSLHPVEHKQVYGGDIEDRHHRHMVSQVRYIVNADKKAQHEVDESSSKTVKHADKVKEAVETYLLKPCRELLSDPRLQVLIKSKKAVSDLGGPERFPQYLDRLVKDLNWKRLTCKKFLKMEDSARAKYFKNLI